MKLKSKDKKIKKWLKQKGAGNRLIAHIEQDIKEGDFDSRDWLLQILEAQNAPKGLIAWLFDKSDPVSVMHDAVQKQYLMSQVQEKETQITNG